MIDPHDLISVARTLVSGTSATDAALRRSVSTIYYALFHTIAACAADRMIGRDAAVAYALIYRGIDHKKIKDVLSDIAKPTLRLATQAALGRSTISSEFKSFAEIVVPMQQLRHLADYHPSLELSLQDVNDLIDEAEAALRTFETLDTQERTDVMALILVGARST